MPANSALLSRLLISERPSLIRLARRIVGSLTAAEDVTQSLWFKIQRVEDDPPILNPKAYLYRLTSNLATDRLRADRRHAVLFENGELPDAMAPVASAEKALIDEENLRIVLTALEELSPQCREIFRLRKFEELTVDDIATRMGLSRSMVFKHLRTALLHCDTRLSSYN
ncbi:MAG: RNA polymerase sigma factor [Asticcacaulis sp.]